jgi:hypothetical protein
MTISEMRMGEDSKAFKSYLKNDNCELADCNLPN